MVNDMVVCVQYQERVGFFKATAIDIRISTMPNVSEICLHQELEIV